MTLKQIVLVCLMVFVGGVKQYQGGANAVEHQHAKRCHNIIHYFAEIFQTPPPSSVPWYLSGIHPVQRHHLEKKYDIPTEPHLDPPMPVPKSSG